MGAGAAPLPDPVCDDDGDVAMFTREITAALVQVDRLHACVVCPWGSVWCWPLDVVAAAVAAESPRRLTQGPSGHVVRRSVPVSWAALPARVGLHPRCVPGLLEVQAWMREGGDPVGEGLPAPGALAVGAPASSPGRARRVGAYARLLGDR